MGSDRSEKQLFAALAEPDAALLEDLAKSISEHPTRAPDLVRAAIEVAPQLAPRIVLRATQLAPSGAARILAAARGTGAFGTRAVVSALTAATVGRLLEIRRMTDGGGAIHAGGEGDPSTAVPFPANARHVVEADLDDAKESVFDTPRETGQPVHAGPTSPPCVAAASDHHSRVDEATLLPEDSAVQERRIAL